MKRRNAITFAFFAGIVIAYVAISFFTRNWELKKVAKS